MAKLEIHQEGGFGLGSGGTKILLDGHEVKDCRRLSLDMNAGEFTEAEITISVTELDVNTEALLQLNGILQFDPHP